ncbi:MAG: polyphosphate kinase 1 [Oscillospiraceae bacterium]|nr:polyphosphate kinase 1 [Oscillospiraceae bacterium]MDD6084162.1 polyphosphate kinase 1 [Oscillospiraceae bacterium]
MSVNIYDNRELSWLKFNQRVLQESLDSAVPLLERLTFTSIFQSNLDEFFMVRVGTLFDQLETDPELRENKTNMTSREQLDAIFERVKKIEPQKDKAYRDIMKLLEKHGIKQLSMDKLTEDEETYISNYFRKEILPLLSPLIIDKRHPLPFIKNKEMYITVRLDSKSGIKLGLLPVNDTFRRIVQLSKNPFRFVLVEDIVLKYASEVFENYSVLEKAIVRITRNADISEDDDSLLDCDFDFRNLMEQLIKKRKKLAPVRLQVFGGSPDSESVKYLCKRLEISDNQIFTASAPLDLSFTFALRSMFEKKKSLCYKPFTPQKSPAVSENLPMADQIRKKDILLHYPYESIKPFIRMLNEAAADPDVVSVKITLYRLARNSKIIQALVDMAERGIDVLVLVELRARFDEENNIGWSKTLQNAGCTIIYGPKGLKVHSKLLLITRKKGDRVEYITQIGTGNYNEKTSELYTDLSLLTANENIAAEALNVFNALSLGHLVEESNHLLVAPLCLQNKVLEMIDEEIAQARAGRKAFIGIKINSLSDRAIIEKLVEASQAGVKTELVIRGLCCLVSGVKGKTDNIRVTSIVGRFLEHSRIYIFGTKQRRKVYISSADFMTRNTVKRVEVAAPVYDPDIQNRIIDIFETMLSDDVKARVQISDGTYRKKRSHKKNLSAQDMFMETASTAASCQNTLSLPENSDTPDFSDFYKEFLMQN